MNAYLEREELIEQAYFFRVLRERIEQNVPMQEGLLGLRDELLATTKLPMAIDFLRAELLHQGGIATAMARLSHYFTPFQTYVIAESENERGRFDMRIGLEILRHDAEYRSTEATPQGAFLYQFETLCRNRLRYDQGLAAMADDPIFDEAWRSWILTVRRQVGIIDLADLIYVRSQYYVDRQEMDQTEIEPGHVVLFGSKEGKIAMANRRKDPLFLLAALQRQLNYPAVPRLKPYDEKLDLVPQLLRRVDRLETRLKLMEEESRGGIDLSRFYVAPPPDDQLDSP